jgi:uncharacterized membrane protein YhaH (DUF805 family)
MSYFYPIDKINLTEGGWYTFLFLAYLIHIIKIYLPVSIFLVVAPINIYLLRKRLNDIGISSWWSVLVLIPIFGQIFSIAMIYPKGDVDSTTNS